MSWSPHRDEARRALLELVDRDADTRELHGHVARAPRSSTAIELRARGEHPRRGLAQPRIANLLGSSDLPRPRGAPLGASCSAFLQNSGLTRSHATSAAYAAPPSATSGHECSAAAPMPRPTPATDEVQRARERTHGHPPKEGGTPARVWSSLAKCLAPSIARQKNDAMSWYTCTMSRRCPWRSSPARPRRSRLEDRRSAPARRRRW